MISSLIINLCIAFTLSYLLISITFRKIATTHRYIYAGIGWSLVSIVLMEFHVPLTTTVFMDLRHLPFIILCLYYDRKSLFIITPLVAFSRFLFGINDSSIIAFYGTWILGLFLYFVMPYVTKYIENQLLKLLIINFLSSLLVCGILCVNLYAYNAETLTIVKSVTIFLIGNLLASILFSLLIQDVISTFTKKTKYLHDSLTDSLTGLKNYRFWEMYTTQLKRKTLLVHPLCCVMIDLDFFKKINDTYGHDYGDTVLKKFSYLLKEHAQQNNIELYCRVGGEEFALLTTNKSSEEILQFLNQLSQELGDIKFINNLHLTCSIGVCFSSSENNDINTLKMTADMALYASKRNGRNQISVYYV